MQHQDPPEERESPRRGLAVHRRGAASLWASITRERPGRGRTPARSCATCQHPTLQDHPESRFNRRPCASRLDIILIKPRPDVEFDLPALQQTLGSSLDRLDGTIAQKRPSISSVETPEPGPSSHEAKSRIYSGTRNPPITMKSRTLPASRHSSWETPLFFFTGIFASFFALYSTDHPQTKRIVILYTVVDISSQIVFYIVFLYSYRRHI